MSANPAPGYTKHPDHRVGISAHTGRVRILHGDTVLADTARALRLEETGYPPVFYIPRADVAMPHLNPFARRTHCPFKGDASYWSLGGSVETEPLAWSYEAPFDEAQGIAGHIAFDADRVRIEPD